MEDEIEKKEERRIEYSKASMNNQEPTLPYMITRFVEVFCIGAFIFGFLWNGTEVLNLTTPQFMMLYGGTGAIVSEVLARIFKKKQNIM